MQARAICSVFPEALYGSERADGLGGFRKQIGRIRSRVSVLDAEGRAQGDVLFKGRGYLRNVKKRA
jgi:hypothetical protein